MAISHIKNTLFLALLVSLLAVSGCASNVVRLSYPAPAESVTPRAGALRICVVLFDDVRTKHEIGQKRDGTLFQARSAVNDWAARAMADELAQSGFSVTYAPSFESALASAPDFIVTGSLEELWLTEDSLTGFTSTMRVNISLLTKNGKHVFKNNFSSTLSKSALPTASAVESILTDSVAGIVQPAAQKIAQTAL